MKGSYISFYSNDVTLELFLDSKSSTIKLDSGLCGFIKVQGPMKEDKEVYWDGIEYFLNVSKKEFKKDCKEELVGIGMDWKDVYQDIREVFNGAKRFSLIPGCSKDVGLETGKIEDSSNWTTSSSADYIGAPSCENEEFVTISQLNNILDKKVREIVDQELGIITPPF
jgi:hypothetical protein